MPDLDDFEDDYSDDEWICPDCGATEDEEHDPTCSEQDQED